MGMMIVRAKANAVLTLHGKPFVVSKGQEFDSGDPIVAEFRDAFQSDAEVERATAAPGERRNVPASKR